VRAVGLDYEVTKWLEKQSKTIALAQHFLDNNFAELQQHHHQHHIEEGGKLDLEI
jgi:hypothetical protein